MAIELGLGSSSQADIVTAGQEAARQAVAHLAGRPPDLVLVFSSIRFADPKLLKAVRSVTGAAPLVGATDAGGISTAGPRRRSVTVIGLLDRGGRFAVEVGRNLSRNPGLAGEQLAQRLRRQVGGSGSLLLLFPDGLAGNGSAILRGARRILGKRVAVAGGCAGDDLYFQRTFQYCNDEVLTDAVPGVLYSGPAKIGIGARHGWIPLGRPRVVTRSSGSIVYELDRRPALSIYEDYLGMNHEELLREPVANLTMTYPLGLAMAGQEEYLLRDALRAGKAGSLVCTGEVAQGSRVRIMIGNYESALQAAKQAAVEAAAAVGRTRLTGALIFCGVARQKMIGSEPQGEVDVIRDALGGSGIRFGGFYSYGEIAMNAFHSESTVVVALG